MMRLIVTLFTIVSVLVPGFGLTFSQSPDQSRCTLTLDKSPAVRGIRLGMGAEQLFALVPESVIKDAVASAEGHPNYGVARLFLQAALYPLSARERFAGIDSIQITLFDGRVTEISVEYAGSGSYPARGPVWRNVDDFITKLSETFALPHAKDWLERSQGAKTLQCTGFTLAASIGRGNGSISLRSTTAYQETVRQRASADEERRRREFKP